MGASMKIAIGQRPTRPATTLCSDSLWTLITGCWSHESRSRPIMSAVLSPLCAEAPFRAGNTLQGRGRFRPSASYTDRAEIRDLRPNEQPNNFAEATRPELMVDNDNAKSKSESHKLDKDKGRFVAWPAPAQPAYAHTATARSKSSRRPASGRTRRRT
jgi:hypothetical protein